MPRTSTRLIFGLQEQRILRLQDEIKRLQGYEQECFRKDEMLGSLRQEVADLQLKVRRWVQMYFGPIYTVTCCLLILQCHDRTVRILLHRLETSEPAFGVDADVAQKLMLLENEVRQKRDEVQSLRDQVKRCSVSFAST